MTEMTLFRCDTCGALYKEESEAEACEEYHVQPTGRTGVTFKPKAESPMPYPAFMRFLMDDGNVVEYIYRSLIGKYEEETPTPIPDGGEPEPDEEEPEDEEPEE